MQNKNAKFGKKQYAGNRLSANSKVPISHMSPNSKKIRIQNIQKERRQLVSQNSKLQQRLQSLQSQNEMELAEDADSIDMIRRIVSETTKSKDAK